MDGGFLADQLYTLHAVQVYATRRERRVDLAAELASCTILAVGGRASVQAQGGTARRQGFYAQQARPVDQSGGLRQALRQDDQQAVQEQAEEQNREEAGSLPQCQLHPAKHIDHPYFCIMKEAQFPMRAWRRTPWSRR